MMLAQPTNKLKKIELYTADGQIIWCGKLNTGPQRHPGPIPGTFECRLIWQKKLCRCD